MKNRKFNGMKLKQMAPAGGQLHRMMSSDSYSSYSTESQLTPPNVPRTPPMEQYSTNSSPLSTFYMEDGSSYDSPVSSPGFGSAVSSVSSCSDYSSTASYNVQNHYIPSIPQHVLPQSPLVAAGNQQLPAVSLTDLDNLTELLQLPNDFLADIPDILGCNAASQNNNMDFNYNIHLQSETKEPVQCSWPDMYHQCM